MTKTKNDDFSRDEALELLRYLIGNPPYVMDNRYRELMDKYRAMPTDDQGVEDPRVNPATLNDSN